MSTISASSLNSLLHRRYPSEAAQDEETARVLKRLYGERAVRPISFKAQPFYLIGIEAWKFQKSCVLGHRAQMWTNIFTNESLHFHGSQFSPL